MYPKYRSIKKSAETMVIQDKCNTFVLKKELVNT